MKRLLSTTILVLFATTSCFSVQATSDLAKGKDLVLQKKYTEALSLLRKEVRIRPIDGEALLWLGKAYLYAGKPDSAEITASNLLLLSDKNVEAVLLLSQSQIEQKKLAEAANAVKKGMKSNRDNPRLWVQLGYIQLARDSTDKSIVSFYKAKEIAPNHAPAYKGLGEAYLKLDANVVAILQFEESIRQDSTQQDLYYVLAKLYYKERQYNEAAQMYTSILRMDPSNDSAALELGQLYYLAKQYSKAAKILQGYVERHPDNNDAWVMHMESLHYSRQHQAAVEAADRILKSQPKSPKVLRVTAKSNHILKHHEKTVEYYQRLSEVDTLTAEDSDLWGRSLAQLKNDSLAIIHFQQSLDKDSTQSDVYADLGAAYMRMKKFDKAAPMFRKKFTMDSTYTSAYINYALCMQVCSNWNESRTALLQALKQNPNYVPSHYHLAYSLSRMDSVQSAKKEYETVITLADTMQTRYKNELGDSYRYISWVYLLEKKYAPALEAITKAIVYKPEDVELHLWRAQTLHALNKRDDAKKEYERVLKLDPNNKDAKRGLDILELYN